jgi:hypothetical protein
MPTLLLTYAVCLLTERACYWIGHFFKIWYIDESIEKMEDQADSVNIDDLYENVEAVARH